jgi:hypothetical protein
MKQIAYEFDRGPITRVACGAVLLATIAAASARGQQIQQIQTYRPFGTLREQADRQQHWLDERMMTVLPSLMRKHKVDMWVVPMREYNEDPVFSSIVSPTTFAARRRTIYLFFDPCGSGGSPSCSKPVEKLAMGGTSQGGVFQAIRSTKSAAGPAGGQAQAQAELWGDEQWQVLKTEIEKRNPKAIAIDVSTVFAFNDGLSAGSWKGCAPRSARNGRHASTTPTTSRSISSPLACRTRSTAITRCRKSSGESSTPRSRTS